MKKQSLLFIAGIVISLASCQDNATDNGANQAQIDSAVNARVEELRTQMMVQNDSLINAEAQRRADSMIAAMGNTAQNAHRTTRPIQPKTNAPHTSTNDAKNDKLNEMSGGNQNDKKEVTPADTKKKKGKLNEMSGN